jgi:hypothetical protein
MADEHTQAGRAETAVRLRVNVRINIIRQYDLDSLDDLTYALALDGYDCEDYDIVSVEEAV